MTDFKKKEFTPLPDGDYKLAMEKFEEAETKNKKGVLGKAEFRVVNGDFKDRRIWHNFMLEHKESEMAVKIGTEQINKYLQAVGVEGGLEELGNDRSLLEEYIGSSFTAAIKTDPPKEYTDYQGATKTSKARNKIAAFKRS